MAEEPKPFLPPLQTIRWRDPLAWLASGLQDLRAAPGPALFYGICFWAMAVVIGTVFRSAPQYTMSFVSGCFLVGPFLAMGLYDASRRRELGLPQDLGASAMCWEGHLRSMAMLVLVLLLLELLWGRASLVVFAVFFETGMPTTATVVDAVFNPANWEFVVVYVAVGGAFAWLVYSTCAVSIPMILDRDTDAVTAGIASLHAVTTHTGPMLFWAGLIVALLVAALVTPWAVALIVVGPWLGHASWHAYRGCYGRAAAPAA